MSGITDDRLRKLDVADISDLDKATEAWAQHVGWRVQLDQLTQIATGIAGKRVDGPGGAKLKMLILRQRNLIDRWVRQAFSEGLLARQSADERLTELEELFDLTWEADMRAVKRWREAHPGNELRMPDRADMVVWLLEQLDALRAAASTSAEAVDAIPDEVLRSIAESKDVGTCRARIRSALTPPTPKVTT